MGRAARGAEDDVRLVLHVVVAALAVLLLCSSAAFASPHPGGPEAAVRTVRPAVKAEPAPSPGPTRTPRASTHDASAPTAAPVLDVPCGAPGQVRLPAAPESDDAPESDTRDVPRRGPPDLTARGPPAEAPPRTCPPPL